MKYNPRILKNFFFLKVFLMKGIDLIVSPWKNEYICRLAPMFDSIKDLLQQKIYKVDTCKINDFSLRIKN